MLYGKKYLDSPDEMGIFPTNADRFNAEEIWKTENLNQQPYVAFVSQLIAAGWHSCSPERLKSISEHIPFVLVCYGLQDKMVEPSHSKYLIEMLGPNTQIKEFPDAGHVLNTEHVREYNLFVANFIDQAEAGREEVF